MAWLDDIQIALRNLDGEAHLSKIYKKVSKKQIEALAIAECMTNNNKGKCFIYAIDDEVVWK